MAFALLISDDGLLSTEWTITITRGFDLEQIIP